MAKKKKKKSACGAKTKKSFQAGMSIGRNMKKKKKKK
jgi:hypothetical protein